LRQSNTSIKNSSAISNEECEHEVNHQRLLVGKGNHQSTGASKTNNNHCILDASVDMPVEEAGNGIPKVPSLEAGQQW